MSIPATTGEKPNTPATVKLRSPKKRRRISRIPAEQHAPYPGGEQDKVTLTGPDNNQPDISANAIRGPPRLWDCATTCAFFGGIDVSTLYRGVHSGRYPRPVNVSDNVVRWLADECEAALQRMIAARDEPKLAERRGRPRRKHQPEITDDSPGAFRVGEHMDKALKPDDGEDKTPEQNAKRAKRAPVTTGKHVPERAADPAKQSSRQLRPRTTEDIANEQTAEQLALRIWSAMVGEKALSGMSDLMDELLQSHLVDDDDEEGDDEAGSTITRSARKSYSMRPS